MKIMKIYMHNLITAVAVAILDNGCSLHSFDVKYTQLAVSQC